MNEQDEFNNLSLDERIQLLDVIKLAIKKVSLKMTGNESSDFFNKKMAIFQDYFFENIKDNIHLSQPIFEDNIFNNNMNFENYFNNLEENKNTLTEQQKQFTLPTIDLYNLVIEIIKIPKYFIQDNSLFIDRTLKLGIPTKTDKFLNLLFFDIQDLLHPNVSNINKELYRLQKTFGFKSILIEQPQDHFESHLLSVWAKSVYDTLKEISSDLNISPKAMSLNGKLALQYSPVLNLMFLQSGVFSSNQDLPSINIGGNTFKDYKNTWIHEYTHSLDYFCGMKYALDNNIEAKGRGRFLSHQIITQIINNHSEFNDDGLNKFADLMSNLLSSKTRESMALEHQEKLTNFYQEAMNFITMEFFKNMPDRFLSTSEDEKKLLKHHCFPSMLKTPIETAIKLGSPTETSKISWEHILNALCIVFNLTKEDKEQNKKIFYENFSVITNELKNLVANHGLSLLELNYDDVHYYFASSDVAKSSREYAEKQPVIASRVYYTRPLEILARESEILYKEFTIDSKNPDYRNIYRKNITEEDKIRAKNTIQVMTSYLGIPALEAALEPKKNSIFSKFKSGLKFNIIKNKDLKIEDLAIKYKM